MFDKVGRNLDDEANKRTATSMFLTLVLLAGGVGAGFGVAAWTAVQVVPDLLEDSEMVEIVMADTRVEDEPPPAPPPPPPPPAAAAEADDDAPDEDDEMSEAIKDLEDPPKEALKSSVPTAGGVDGGVDGGVKDGVVDGRLGGVPGGDGDGELGGVKVMHHSELVFRKRAVPEYPAAAKELGLGDQRCLATVFIDETGTPYDVKVEGCPKVFHASTLEGLLKSRWYPPKAGREKVKAQTTIAVNYKLH